MEKMMISHSEKQIEIKNIDALAIINFLQFGCASGFTKNYASKLVSGDQKREFLNTVEFMISDLNQDQLKSGVIKLRDSGFCPDLNLFRRWCLGLEGFDTPEDKIRKTYLGEDAALAHIINYSKKNSDFSTNAMMMAYQDTYSMFLDLNTSEKPERLIFQVHKSFKQCYLNRVDELVKNGISQIINEERKSIGSDKKMNNPEYNAKPVEHRPYG